MKILFGEGFDGIKPKHMRSSIGEKEVGPMGFLSILETQCGIAPVATVVAGAPGIGGEQWRQTLDELLGKEKFRDDYSEKRFNKLQADLDYWFASDRYTHREGLPIEVAKQRISKVANWLSQQQSHLEDEAMRALFGAAYSQARELNSALRNLLVDGTTHIPASDANKK